MARVNSKGARVSKSEFLELVVRRSGEPLHVVREVYEAILEELTAAVTRGEVVVLHSFGRFYRQNHKGHKVRFRTEDVDDYSVLKFSASRTVNSALNCAVKEPFAFQRKPPLPAPAAGPEREGGTLAAVGGASTGIRELNAVPS